MNHIKLFEEFSLSKKIKGNKVKGLFYLSSDASTEPYWIKVSRKENMFSKPKEEKYILKINDAAGRSRWVGSRDWFDEKGNEVTDLNLIKDLNHFWNLRH